MEQILLSIADVSDATHLGETTIKELLARGEIESITVGRSRRIPATALRDWVDRKRGEADFVVGAGSPSCPPPDSTAT